MDGSIVYLLFRDENPSASRAAVLLGETSNGDVARTEFSKDYDVDSLADAQLEERLLPLQARGEGGKRDSTYRSVSLWVEKSKDGQFTPSSSPDESV